MLRHRHARVRCVQIDEASYSLQTLLLEGVRPNPSQRARIDDLIAHLVTLAEGEALRALQIHEKLSALGAAHQTTRRDKKMAYLCRPRSRCRLRRSALERRQMAGSVQHWPHATYTRTSPLGSKPPLPRLPGAVGVCVYVCVCMIGGSGGGTTGIDARLHPDIVLSPYSPASEGE